MRRSLVVSAAVVALLGAGCGPKDPYAQDRAAKVNTTPQRPAHSASRALGATDPTAPAPTSGEVPGTVPHELRAPTPRRFPDAGHTPRDTVRIAAGLYGNWTSRTAPRAFARIAAISVREARAQLRQVAAQAGADVQQRGVRSRSQVVTIRLSGSGSVRRATVVTRDTVRGPGLDDPADYHATRAVLERRGDRWVLSRWEPQP